MLATIAESLGAAPIGWPERMDLLEDSLPQHVAGMGESECGVRMQALQATRRARAAIPDSSDAPSSFPAALRRGRAALRAARRSPVGANAQARRLSCGPAPAFDSSRGFETRERGHEMRARQVVGRREGVSFRVVRLLLGYCRPAVRTADGHAAQRTRRPAELTRDDRPVIHPSGHYAGRASTPESP